MGHKGVHDVCMAGWLAGGHSDSDLIKYFKYIYIYRVVLLVVLKTLFGLVLL